MQRSVRFQQIFPSFRAADCQIPSPVPLFSPTQAGNGEQKVLHSIFSPMQSAESKRQANKENTPPVPLLLAPTSSIPQHAEANKSMISQCSTEAFYSPAQTVHSSITGISPLSVLSRESTRSYRNHQKQASAVSLSKLNLDYITNCNSVSELHRIVTALAADNSYPSLLRAAKERLTEVRQGLRIEETAIKEATQPTVSPRANESHFSHSTLIMSLSSDEDESFDVVVPPPSNSDTIFRVSNDDVLHRRIHELTMKIVEMEGKSLTEQEQYHATLSYLQSAKNHADSKIRSLEEALAKSTGTTNELLQSLETLRQQNEELKHKLDEEKKARTEKLRQAQEVESRLSAELKELNERLSEADRYRQKEKEMSLLVSAQRNLEKIKNERNQLIRCLLDATGQSNMNVNQMTDENRRKLTTELNKKIQASRTALNAMAAALSRSEDNRKQAIKAQKLAEQEFWKLSDSNEALQQQNRSLSEHIQALTREVKSSRAHADLLLQSAEEHQRKAWQETERKYKQIIRGLKEQLREQAATVPMELYRNAVDEKKEIESKFKEKQAEIEELTAKVTKLEQQLVATHLPPMDCNESPRREKPTLKTQLTVDATPQPPPPSNRMSKERADASPSSAIPAGLPPPSNPTNTKHAGPFASAVINAGVPPPPPPTPKINSTPMTASQTKPSRPPVTFSFTPIGDSASGQRPRVRISMIRAAGGRKVLEEQLQRRLSPKPAMHGKRVHA